MEKLLGQTLNNRYRLDLLLGQGGMGAVFKGFDTTLARLVAVKVMHSQYAHQATFRQRFLREAQAAASMNHSGIVRVHDFGEQPPYLFIVMQFIPGENLGQMLDKLKASNQRIMLSEVVQLTRQVCLALHYLHQQGVLHRDIKPSNIMITGTPVETLPYQPVLTDLGLAKLIDESGLTVEGTSLGTPAYMSPEQAKGEPADARSDVYSTGILLYELATGDLPFPIKNFADALRYHAGVQPPAPRSRRPDLPSALDQAILKALQKEPADRFADSEAMADALAVAIPAIPKDATPMVEEGAASLLTQYQQSLVQPPGRTWIDDFPTPPSNAIQDSIAIRAPDGAIRTAPITAREITIGRTLDNTIVLDDPNVSRHHARIVLDGGVYKVTDLKSTNGTLLAGARLLEGVQAAWSADSPLHIGDHTMRLQPARRTDARSSDTIISPKSMPVAAMATLETAELRVDPGSPVTVTAVILNQGQMVDHFRFGVIGVPGDWIVGPLPLVQLMPQASRTVSLVIQPPRSPQSRAGSYPLTVQVTSQSDPNQIVEAKGTLTVAPFQQFQVELRPQRQSGIAEGNFRVLVKNLGNADLSFELAAIDPEEGCQYTFDSQPVTLAAGEERTVQLLVRPKTALVQDQPRRYPFTVSVRPTAAAQLAQQVQGEWVQTPPVFDLTAHPSSASGALEGAFTVTVANRGEADLVAALEASDPSGVCTFMITPLQVAVPVGQEQSARLVVRSQAQPSVDRSRSYAVAITARPAGAPRASRQVQVTWEQTPAPRPLPESVVLPRQPGIPESVVAPVPQKAPSPQVQRVRKPRRFLGLIVFLLGLVATLVVGVFFGIAIQEPTISIIGGYNYLPLSAIATWLGGLILSFVVARKVWRGK